MHTRILCAARSSLRSASARSYDKTSWPQLRTTAARQNAQGCDALRAAHGGAARHATAAASTRRRKNLFMPDLLGLWQDQIPTASTTRTLITRNFRNMPNTTSDQRVVTFTGILGTAEDPRDPSKRVQVFIPVKAVTAATEAVKAAEDCVKSTVSMAAVSVPASDNLADTITDAVNKVKIEAEKAREAASQAKSDLMDAVNKVKIETETACQAASQAKRDIEAVSKAKKDLHDLKEVVVRATNAINTFLEKTDSWQYKGSYPSS